jgi:nucleoside-diphosphate-sugar epimerase
VTLADGPREERRSLVFGASGFLGRWVAAALAPAEQRVTVAVRDVASARDVLARWGVDADLHAVDLEQPGAAAALIERVRPTHVFNLAAYGVDRSQRDEALARRLNFDLVTELAVACAPSAQWTGAT